MNNVAEVESNRKDQNFQPCVGGVDGEFLKSTVERIQNLGAEEREVSQQKAEVYKEVEDRLDKRALKIIVRRLRKARAEIDEEDFLVAEYERALGIGDRGEPPGYVLLADLAPAPGRARSNGHAKPAARHEEAYAVGKVDGFNNSEDSASRWPAGEAGHADYWLGFCEGRVERVDRLESDALSPIASSARRREEASA